MNINKNNLVTKMPNSMDYLYQAISLIEAKGYSTQQFQPISELASNILGESKKRIIGTS